MNEQQSAGRTHASPSLAHAAAAVHCDPEQTPEQQAAFDSHAAPLGVHWAERAGSTSSRS
jgi:hypothetical protein